MKESPPDVVGLTYYVWGVNLANHVASIAKALNPRTLTVGGGPHFTSLNANEEAARRFFSDEGSNCDAFVVNQGEKGFAELLTQFLACDKSVERLRRETVSGCLVNNLAAGDSVQVGRALPTIDNLDDIPSPYLTGLLDSFFDGPYAPILETNRSCPYRCTFCAWGIGTEKLTRYSDERISAEIEYFGKRSNNTKNLYIADANFAILERDANISRQLFESHEKYGYPGNVMVNWNKTRPDRVLRAAREFHGLARIGASMQSLNQCGQTQESSAGHGCRDGKGVERHRNPPSLRTDSRTARRDVGQPHRRNQEIDGRGRRDLQLQPAYAPWH